MTDPTPAEALKAEDDAPETYEVSRLPLLLREHVDMVLACEAEPHVIEDARAIVAQAADYIAAALSPPDAGEVRTYREGVAKEGWLLMPAEPTPEMIAAAWDVVTEAKNARQIHRLGTGVGTVDVYRAMVAAIRKLP